MMVDNAGKYHLIAQIDEAFPHRVSVGTCRKLSGGGQLVLVRHPLPGVLDSADEQERLLARVHQLVGVTHPNLATIYDVENDAFGVSFVGAYLEGQTLAAILQAARTVRNAFPHRVLLRMVADTLAGLVHLHGLRDAAGQPLHIVHGGIHPGSVVVTYDGTTKIVGLESIGVRLDWRPAAPSVTAGASYAAPEQLSDGEVDARADLFAVGLLMWDIVARQPLFQGARDGIRRRLAEGELPSITSLVRGVPDALQAILQRALRINSGERYASAAEMLRDVENYVASTGPAITATQLAERMRAVFAADAANAALCTAAWQQGATLGAGTVGPGGWLGASAVRPPSLHSATSGVPISPDGAALPYTEARPGSADSRSLMVIPSLSDFDQQAAPRRSRLALGVVLGAALAFVAVGAVMAMGLAWRWSAGSSTPLESPRPTTTAPAAPQTKPSAGTETSPENPGQPSTLVKSATVRLESEPGNAAVEWQGQMVGRTPIQLTVPLGIQYFAVSQPGYKRQDVVIDTSVAAGPEGFSTKVLLTAEDKVQKLTNSAIRRPGAQLGQNDSSTERNAIRPRSAAAASASSSTSPAPAAASNIAAPPEVPARPAPFAPKIRAIDAASPTIRTIDADSGEGKKVRVIDDE